ncbi:MAG: hypothetical protein H0U49_00030 [Parachlamydiaceae bacterium]|nr:hypothetical protein [Parachlamydiaceae bacterium]
MTVDTMLVVALGVVTGAAISAVKWSDTRFNKDEVENNERGYAPDRPLPQKEGVLIPDTDAPHTQLGLRSGRRGRYRQAREFDKDGKPLRDINFTDHSRPHEHTKPHQHPREENPTGGTRTREAGEPLPGWQYE